MAGKKVQSTVVKVDDKKLRDAIVAKFSLNAMARIIGRGVTYFSPSADRGKRGMEINDLERVCMVLGRDVSEFIIVEPETIVEKSTEETKAVAGNSPLPAPQPTSDAGVTALKNIYEAIELNGEALGKLIAATEANTAALNAMLEEFKKTGTTVTNWSQKWANHKKYGRF